MTKEFDQLLSELSKGTFYLYSIDASSHEKTVDYLLGLLEDAIFHIDEEHVVLVYIDNAANYVLVGKKLMEKNNKIFGLLVQHIALILCLRTLENCQNSGK